jgi:Family of unknown function (DUF6328)
VPLRAKVKNALDEARILVLGTQVLLGFQYRAFFEPSFEKLPRANQDLKLAGLALLLAVMGLVMVPAARHRVVERGEDTSELHRFTMNSVGLALLPFAAALGLDLYDAGWTRSPKLGVALGIGGFLLATGFWFGIALIFGRRKPQQERGGEMKLEDKIVQVLTEARVVLPGAQAMLGFQLAMTLMEGYEKLPDSSKNVHVGAICFIALTIVFLMAPAAYHRFVEGGEDTESFHRFASWMVIAALVALPPGFAGDLWIVVRKQTRSTGAANAVAAVALTFFYGLWFFAMLAIRCRHDRQRTRA